MPDSFTLIYKLTTAQLKELYKKYLGIDFDPAIHADNTVYLKEYDSYYYSCGYEGQSFYFNNICAWEMEDGNIIVLFENTGDIEFFATLKPVSDGYIFKQAFRPEWE